MVITYLSGERVQGSSEKSGYTVVGSNVSFSDGVANIATSSDDSRIYRSHTITNNQNWVIDFDCYTGTGSSGHVIHAIVLSQESTRCEPNDNSGNDGFCIRLNNTDSSNLTLYLQERESGTGDQQSTFTGSNFAKNTQYYMRWTRNGTAMTLKVYSDSARTSQVNSTQTLTLQSTSVQDIAFLQHGSETTSSTVSGVKIDNIKIYHNMVTPSGTPAFQTDFTDEKASLVTDADAGWTDNDSARIDVTGGALTWEMKRDGTNDSTIYDLTSTSANWVLRFKVSGSSYNTTIQAGNGFFFGISDSNQGTAQNASQDFIGMSYYYDNTSSYRAVDADGASLPHLYQGDEGQNFSSQLTSSSVHYFEIIKTGSSYTVEAFTNSDYSTGSLGEISGSSSATGLRYIKIMNELSNGTVSTSTNPFQGTIDDLKFYDNVTSATGTATYETTFSVSSDLPAGTRFEETDTRKIYRMKDNAWVLRGVAA